MFYPLPVCSFYLIQCKSHLICLIWVFRYFSVFSKTIRNVEILRISRTGYSISIRSSYPVPVLGTVLRPQAAVRSIRCAAACLPSTYRKGVGRSRASRVSGGSVSVSHTKNFLTYDTTYTVSEVYLCSSTVVLRFFIIT